MAEKLDPRQELATFDELLLGIMLEHEATRRVLVRKGVLTNEEVLESRWYGGSWKGNEGYPRQKNNGPQRPWPRCKILGTEG